MPPLTNTKDIHVDNEFCKNAILSVRLTKLGLAIGTELGDAPHSFSLPLRVDVLLSLNRHSSIASNEMSSHTRQHPYTRGRHCASKSIERALISLASPQPHIVDAIKVCYHTSQTHFTRAQRQRQRRRPDHARSAEDSGSIGNESRRPRRELLPFMGLVFTGAPMMF
ncbi:hypothetical protein BDN72DRAFT_522878 [Pluteus cervinus]|uniref:Uncharacterized protein n=1 Tax=Pluteus cervinus TaxID=181527 RepID=A0ACD3A4I0_9AGAR|nr:hypothetical protein BDN72DRAFT_522878 [Pluteus cervinus]